jgi:hypothetical protein
VQLLPSSARARRRLLRVGIVVALAAVVALLIAFVPRGHTFGNNFSSAPAQTVRKQKQVPLTSADRREIDRVLDGFVGPAVGRRDPLRARRYAAPDLLRGTTREDWVRGDIAVPPYPVRPGPTHEYVVLYSFRDVASLELGLHPRKHAKVGNAAFFVTMRRVHRRWRVASIALHAEYPP